MPYLKNSALISLSICLTGCASVFSPFGLHDSFSPKHLQSGYGALVMKFNCLSPEGFAGGFIYFGQLLKKMAKSQFITSNQSDSIQIHCSLDRNQYPYNLIAIPIKAGYYAINGWNLFATGKDLYSDNKHTPQIIVKVEPNKFSYIGNLSLNSTMSDHNFAYEFTPPNHKTLTQIKQKWTNVTSKDVVVYPGRIVRSGHIEGNYLSK